MNTIGAETLSKMFLAGAKALDANKEHINELNVFPVPDGDTGTNMSMTVLSAAREVLAIDRLEMRSLCKAISSGSLRGARGNSGVILSQLLRGFTKVIKTEEELSVDILCEAAQKAVETAYKAVMQPKEGTILTVARAGADKALELCDETDDVLLFLEGILLECRDVLKKTPEMLPVLKEAGVVDSGGEGLCQILSGAYAFLSGKDTDISIEKPSDEKEKAESKFIYRMEFKMLPFPRNSHEDRRELRQFMRSLGDGAYLEKEGSDSYYTGKLITNDPGRVISRALLNGSLEEISIINTRPAANKRVLESDEAQKKSEGKKETPQKEIGIAAVSTGKGINRIFTELGADAVIEGGQTMNPSTDDIIKAIEGINAKNVFVLPNNKNIILSAEQAAKMISDKKVMVLPSKTIPQGICALIGFMPQESAEENFEHMSEEMTMVRSGEITYAVRDTSIDGRKIDEGDYMGIGDEGILCAEKKIEKTMLAMLEKMIDEDSALVTLYYGADVSEEDSGKLFEKIKKTYPDLEVEMQDGGQPVYYYIVSVE